MKKCPKCGIEKRETEYYIQHHRKSKPLQAYCKPCLREYTAACIARKKAEKGEAYNEEHAAYHREYREKNRDKIKAYQKEYQRKRRLEKHK